MAQFMKFRRILMVIVLILQVIMLTQINYTDLSFKTNKFNYLSIVTGICIILTLYLSNKKEKKELA